ncbi:MAG: EamA family transporter [Mesobacillus sp.]|uniref:EamA family transporter n=1 Tax=Mesobacillus sp. TaxID=2675271 RepID=UPI003C4AF5E3
MLCISYLSRKFANGFLLVTLVYTSPMFAIFLAWFYFKERITGAKLAASLITITGIVIIPL